MKTHSKFDYDLWTTEENGIKRFWTRLKASGEITEVNEEIFKFMNSEDKKIRRQISDEIGNIGTIYSLDAENEDGLTLSDLISDSFSLEENVIEKEYLTELKNQLSKTQLRFVNECIEGDKSIAKFAEENGVTGQAVQNIKRKIRRKHKKYPDGGFVF